MQDCLVFRLGPERFGVPLDAVREIRRPGRVTPLPEAPTWLRGVTNLRGVILAVVDLGLALGLGSDPTPTVGRKSRLVVMRDRECDAGFFVDAVEGVFVVDGADCRAVPDGLAEQLRRWCDGIVRDDAGFVTVLSPELLTGLQERLRVAV